MKPDDAGMHLVGWLPDSFDGQEAARKAAEVGVRVSPISEHSIQKYPHKGLVFGYAAFDEKQIRSGIAKLTEVLTEMTRTHNYKSR